MNLLEADSRLRKTQQSCLTTRDVAAYLGVSIVYASNILRRLAAADRIVRIGRGRWLWADSLDSYSVPEHITAPWPTYISLQTALYHHGMISQIPAVVYAISLARTRRFKNPAGEFSIHHISPEFFFGFETIGSSSLVKMAVPEKALIDYLYLFSVRSRIFRSLPELSLPRSFSIRSAREMIEKIPSTAKRTLVRKQFEEVCGAESK